MTWLKDKNTTCGQRDANMMQPKPCLASMVMLAAAMGDKPKREPSWIDEIDIDQEYELIQQKKSRLSKSKRDQVVRAYKTTDA